MFTSKMLKISSFIPAMLAATLAFVATGCHAGVQGGIEAGFSRSPVAASPLTLNAGCYRIQRGVHREVADTHISQKRDERNYGLDPSSRVGAADTAEHRTLLGFDLRDIPKGALVVSATMNLSRQMGGRANLSVHRVTESWSELDTTWRKFGNAYDSQAAATLQLSDDSQKGKIEFDVTDLVRSWVSGEYPNQGVMVKDNEGDSVIAMSESFSDEDHPRLEVCLGADFAPTRRLHASNH